MTKEHMKELTLQQEAIVKKLEEKGDELFEKETFESCLSALDCYASAQEELYKLANENDMLNAKPWPSFNSSNVTYKSWYAELNSKMTKANAKMSDSKIVRK